MPLGELQVLVTPLRSDAFVLGSFVSYLKPNSPCPHPSWLRGAVPGERSWNFLFHASCLWDNMLFYLGEMNKDYLHPFSTKPHQDDASCLAEAMPGPARIRGAMVQQ